jgi:hypothetical protein
MQQTAVIDYRDDGYACEGFAVWDDAGTKRPGILALLWQIFSVTGFPYSPRSISFFVAPAHTMTSQERRADVGRSLDLRQFVIRRLCGSTDVST